eukprot:SAG11_NODE_13155_length_667_cov_2.040493_1_plen_52_part_01
MSTSVLLILLDTVYISITWWVTNRTTTVQLSHNTDLLTRYKLVWDSDLPTWS